MTERVSFENGSFVLIQHLQGPLKHPKTIGKPWGLLPKTSFEDEHVLVVHPFLCCYKVNKQP